MKENLTIVVSVITIVSTILLTISGIIQIIIANSQKEQTRISLVTQYRELWDEYKEYWGIIIFISRRKGEYYQILNEEKISELTERTKEYIWGVPTIWTLESIQKISGLLGEISTRIMQGHLKVSDIYPIFGTQFLRQSRPLRELLESEYGTRTNSKYSDENHNLFKSEVQDWLVYHDGLRRRCLILIDLLWAESARLEDLPPYEMQSGANAKQITGKLNRKRVFKEVYRLNGIKKLLLAFCLAQFLRRAEYKTFFNRRGIDKGKLEKLNNSWTERLLKNY